MKLQHEARAADCGAAALRVQHEKQSTPATVGAVIVLYHPNPEHLRRLAQTVTSQVDRIFLIDNTPGENDRLPAAFDRCPRPIAYHAIGANRGIATAQNIGIERAMREGCTHVLLLDQDSALPAEAVDKLLAAEQDLLRAGKNVAAVGPQYIDEKDGKRCSAVGPGWIRVRWREIPAGRQQPVESDYVIASGSLIRTSVLAEVGWMRDELFIDWVDAEWAYRAKSQGYTAFIVPTVVMMHSIGEATGYILSRPFNIHSPARNYYIVRNAAYLLKERHMSWRWRMAMLVYIPKYILVHSWISGRRWRSLRELLRAVWEGLTGAMRPFAAQ